MSQHTAYLPRDEPGAITFIVNGEIHRVLGTDPNRTLLNHLREDCALTGTKEGCAEGDCGACTVVVTELHGENLRSRAVNACIQLLPTLHGKEVTTVEGLNGPDGGLHPVQKAMVDCHASQCGFCTPGFVMSLHALTESVEQPSRGDIECALAGNLCRCTGYRPIVDAALRIREYSEPASAPAHDGAAARSARIDRLRTINAGGSVELNHRDRAYWAPTSLAEFAEIRADHPQAIVLAGGTDIGLTVTKKHADLPALVYIGGVSELKQITLTPTCLDIGAAATLSDAFDALLGPFPELAEWARRFASPPIRNVGTLGGNIGNGSPIGDSMPVLMALDASLVLQHGTRTREVPLNEFYVGYQRSLLQSGEFIAWVRIPLKKPGVQLRAYKISKRFDQDISALCAAFALRIVDGLVIDARVAFGGMAAVPKRAAGCESALVGRPWKEEAVRAAMEALEADFEPIDDMRASKGYRRMVAQNLFYKFYLETTGIERISVVANEA